jgi:ribosomal protein L13
MLKSVCKATVKGVLKLAVSLNAGRMGGRARAGVSAQVMENVLPSFWSDGLCRIFGDAVPVLNGSKAVLNGAKSTGSAMASKAANPRPGKKASTEVKREKAKMMRVSGYTGGEIANSIRSYACELVNGPG